MSRGAVGARVSSLRLLLVAAVIGCSGAPSEPAVLEVELPGATDEASIAVDDPGGPAPVHVVRILRSGRLGSILVDELRKATEAGERLLVMTNGAQCRACRRFLHALGDRAVREALAGVVVIRVDIARFEAELAPLGLQSYVMPAFFLLDERGHARDSITGSEWTDDVAENIAPVIGAFAREQYPDRKAERTR